MGRPISRKHARNKPNAVWHVLQRSETSYWKQTGVLIVFCLYPVQLPRATRLRRDTGNWSHLPQPLPADCMRTHAHPFIDTLTSPPIPPGDSCKRPQKGLLLQSILPLPLGRAFPHKANVGTMGWRRCCEDGPAFPSHRTLQFVVQHCYLHRSMQRRTYRRIHNARNLASRISFFIHLYQRPNPPSQNVTTATTNSTTLIALSRLFASMLNDDAPASTRARLMHTHALSHMFYVFSI